MTRTDSGTRGQAVGSWKSRLALVMGLAVVVGMAAAARWMSGPAPASAQNPLMKLWRKDTPAPQAPAAEEEPPQAVNPSQEDMPVAAVVNGQPITREDLAKECIWHYGEEVLESLVNKWLIAEHCSRHSVAVTQEDVDAEIARSAERWGLPIDQWLKMLKEDRGISPEQYASDIIWPTVALRKLASQRIEPTERDMIEAYETRFGEAVQVRLIACQTADKAQQVRQMALANPDDFGNLAKEHSIDVNSASAKGLIQPVRRHVGDTNIEASAFNLQPGQISDIIQVGDQYVILKCDTRIPAQKVPMEQVEKVLRDAVRDKKMRLVAADVFRELQSTATVEIVFNDEQKRQQYPGVAAVINGRSIAMSELAEECLKRHGVEVLEGTISHRLLEQELKRRALAVTQAELDGEVARAAISMGKQRADGSADMDAWIKEVTDNQGIAFDLYVHDAVWPSVALKKLVGERIEITDEDLTKGYEANFGPRVRCRAIVLDNLRRAQEVWDKARANPTPENFGQLAEQYSVEASSRALQGEVPPIQKHGGQPLLEQEAFALQPGEVSSIVQMGDKFVVLYCEGFTTPTQAEFSAVRQEIYNDIHEKKLRIAMAQEFARVQQSAQIDNFLAGTTQAGKNAAPLANSPAPGDVSAGPAEPRTGSNIAPTTR